MKMNLHEEFELYENMWEDLDPETLKKARAFSDSIDAWGTFSLEYDGFTNEDFEDKYDPDSLYGHYTIDSSETYGSFTYELEADKAWDYITDKLPDHIDQESEFAQQYNNLCSAMNNATAEEFADADDKFNEFLVANLDKLVDMFKEELKDYFEDDAHRWAVDNLPTQAEQAADDRVDERRSQGHI